MEEDIISLEFNSPKEVLKHIKNTGVNALSQTIWTKSDLINFEKNYPQTNQEKFSLTYNPVYIKTRAI
jgi:malonyl-CoA O-methyltransferase